MSLPPLPEVVRSPTSSFELAVAPGAVEAVLRDPARREVGRWRFGEGRRLCVELLGRPQLTLDGEAALEETIAEGAVAWPRMGLELQGRVLELVSSDRELLRRHYQRPHHQEVSYVAEGEPDRLVGSFHSARIGQARRLLRGVDGRVLDIGSGYSLVHMAGPWDFSLVVCDRDPGAMRHVREQGYAVPVLGSVDEVPFLAASFDAVYAGEIVEHLPDPDAALRQWVAMLKPGGRLVVTTPNRRHLWARASGREQVVNPEHLFEYSPAELRAALVRAGARVERLEGLHLPLPVPLPRLGWRELVAGVHRRRPLPGRAYDLVMAAGRPFPGLAHNLAAVAMRP